MVCASGNPRLGTSRRRRAKHVARNLGKPAAGSHRSSELVGPSRCAKVDGRAPCPIAGRIGARAPSTERLRSGDVGRGHGMEGGRVRGGGVDWLGFLPAMRHKRHEAVRMAEMRLPWTLGVHRGACCAPWSPPKRPAVVLAAGRSLRMKHADAMKATQLTLEDREILLNRPKACSLWD